MVDNSAKPLVTITGVSGYLGSQTCLAFLQDGSYRVRGTVRDTTDQAKLQPLRDAFGALFDQLELVEADLCNDAQIAAAIAGATYVVHTASPFFFGTDAATLITPAVEGTKSVMRACKENRVRRCVITASIASVLYQERHGEDGWDETTWSQMEWPGISMYAQSKLMAEKAAWEFQSELPEAEKFELVTILPGFILGPALRVESSISIDFCLNLVTGKLPAIPYRSMPIVDVRDCAQMHLKAIQVPEAANHRFLSTNESVWMKDLAAPVIERFVPQGWPVTTALAPAPEGDDGWVNKCNNAKSRQLLGMQYRPYAETMVDMAAKMIEIGAAKKPE